MDTCSVHDTSPKINRWGLTYAGKVAIITGGAKGIGEGCARVFVDAGAHVVILDIDKAAGSRLASELDKKGPGTCFFIEGDASKSKDLKCLIDETVQRYNAIDCLINNAGVHPPIQYLTEATEEDFIKLLKMNVVGPVLACQLAEPHLIKSGGNIINMGSLVSKIGQEGAAMYAASKGAIDSFGKAYAIELGNKGVRINTVLPSNVYTSSRTEGVARLPGDPLYWENWINSNQQNHKSATPEQIGQVCLSLATTLDFVHGASIDCDYGAKLGYGPKSPHTFLNSSQQPKRWDAVENPDYKPIVAKL